MELITFSIPCRKRHLKCMSNLIPSLTLRCSLQAGDRRSPVCTNCKRARARPHCTYSGVKFRASRLSILAKPDQNGSSETSETETSRSQDDHGEPLTSVTSPASHLEITNDDTVQYGLTSPPAPSYGEQRTRRSVYPDIITEQISPTSYHVSSPETLNHQAIATRDSFGLDSEELQVFRLASQSSHSPHSPLTGPLATQSYDKVKIREDEWKVFQFYLQNDGVWVGSRSLQRAFADAG